MWRPWAKSPVKIHDTSSQFSCSSFKDIQSLCTEDSLSTTSTNTPTRKASIFHRVRLANSVIRALGPRPPPQLDTSSFHDNKNLPQPQPQDLQPPPPPPPISIPGAEKRIVVYFTSLRVVRSTFEDCKAVRSILRGFRVQVDERDLSMDSNFIKELQVILGVSQGKLTLPRVFIGGRYIGGAEEIRQLHETGELKKFVEGFPTADIGACDVCGGYSFLLCDECDGSHKMYAEKAGGFKSCAVCNENGLIRCPSCSFASFSTV
ncbi:uncharacterized protein At5g39865 [Mangifera indica]|uniref:uncharacterized protein At5g39865 n=1 Tax=Mangifera indica TaxID=29780 RepID=UPI001CFC1E68|nr:uncharacterized protein At5g39865 [Mangifera indica]